MRIKKDIILGAYFTGVFDVNRNETLPNDDINPILPWLRSLIKFEQSVVIFHNSFSDNTISLFEDELITFLPVKLDANYNPNVYRYFLYNNFLKENIHLLNNIFVTDVTDVEMLNNPFISNFFIEHNDKIFCGDEPTINNNKWMRDHNEFFRNSIDDFKAYENNFANDTLLNCGIIGGKAIVMQQFLDELCSLHQSYNQNNPTAFTGDMGLFNYLIRTKSNGQVYHGSPVNTVFKQYEYNNVDCWFRHK